MDMDMGKADGRLGSMLAQPLGYFHLGSPPPPHCGNAVRLTR